MSSRQRKAIARNRTAAVMASRLPRTIRKETHKPEASRQGREECSDARTSARGCHSLGARLRNHRCALDPCGLGALATIFSVYPSNSAQALAVNDTGLKAEALVSASLELSTYQLLMAGDEVGPLLGSFNFRVDNAGGLFTVISQGGCSGLHLPLKQML